MHVRDPIGKHRQLIWPVQELGRLGDDLRQGVQCHDAGTEHTSDALEMTGVHAPRQSALRSGQICGRYPAQASGIFERKSSIDAYRPQNRSDRGIP